MGRIFTGWSVVGILLLTLMLISSQNTVTDPLTGYDVIGAPIVAVMLFLSVKLPYVGLRYGVPKAVRSVKERV